METIIFITYDIKEQATLNYRFPYRDTIFIVLGEACNPVFPLFPINDLEMNKYQKETVAEWKILSKSMKLDLEYLA